MLFSRNYTEGTRHTLKETDKLKLTYSDHPKKRNSLLCHFISSNPFFFDRISYKISHGLDIHFKNHRVIICKIFPVFIN